MTLGAGMCRREVSTGISDALNIIVLDELARQRAETDRLRSTVNALRREIQQLRAEAAADRQYLNALAHGAAPLRRASSNAIPTG